MEKRHFAILYLVDKLFRVIGLETRIHIWIKYPCTLKFTATYELKLSRQLD